MPLAMQREPGKGAAESPVGTRSRVYRTLGERPVGTNPKDR